jgi:RNA polymerase sigma-70 factor (ECF subfamily)
MEKQHEQGLADCLARLRAGELQAREDVIASAAERMRTIARRMLARFPNVRRWEDTDDVFQAAAMRLHRTLGQLSIDSPRDLLALAVLQIRRELLDLARSHAGPESYAAHQGTNAIPGKGSDAGQIVERIEDAATTASSLDRWTRFHRAIDELPADLREVFQLVWFMHADQKTIAATIGCSERTVKARWRAARLAIRSALDGEPPE